MENVMKTVISYELSEIIYTFDEFNRIKKTFAISNETINCMYGRDLKKLSKCAVKEKLSDDVLYIARFMKDVNFDTPNWEDKLVFFHVTYTHNKFMHKAKKRQLKKQAEENNEMRNDHE